MPKPAKKHPSPTNNPTYAAVCTPILGSNKGECRTDRKRCRRITIGKVIQKEALGSSDNEERRKAAEISRDKPIERMMELMRWRHETNTGILCVSLAWI